MVHDPAARIETVDPTTVQPPAAVKLTGRPELADALIENVASPYTLLPSDSKVMVDGALAMANDCETSPAGAKASLPAWWAVMVHEPAAVIETVELTRLQSPVAVKFTGRPELADALTENAGSP